MKYFLTICQYGMNFQHFGDAVCRQRWAWSWMNITLLIARNILLDYFTVIASNVFV
jgi:hypothetical protein